MPSTTTSGEASLLIDTPVGIQAKIEATLEASYKENQQEKTLTKKTENILHLSPETSIKANLNTTDTQIKPGESVTISADYTPSNPEIFTKRIWSPTWTLDGKIIKYQLTVRNPDGPPSSDTPQDPRVTWREQGLTNTWIFTPTEPGTHTITFTIDEVWYWDEQSYNKTYATDTVSETIKVTSKEQPPQEKPVCNIKEATLVQIVERARSTPTYRSTSEPTIADRPAALRIQITTPNTTQTQIPLQITVPGTSITKTHTITLTKNTQTIDTTLTLPEGGHTVNIELDPQNNHLSTDSEKQVGIYTEAKPTKPLELDFVSIEIPMFGKQTKRELIKYILKHREIVHDTYPIKQKPDVHLYNVWPPVLMRGTKRTTVLYLSTLSFEKKVQNKSPHTINKIIGITPNNWWEKDKHGVAYPLSQRDACLVKHGSQSNNAVAHELGHLCGLYIWPFFEQYELDQYSEEGGIVLRGSTTSGTRPLVERDGTIYDLSNQTQAIAFYTDPNSGTDLKQPGRVMDIMAVPDNTYGYWISREVYRELQPYFLDPPTETQLYVSGIIDPSGETLLGKWQIVETEPMQVPEGDYTLIQEDTNGQTLHTTSFGTTQEPTVFSFTTPLHPETAKVQIKNGGTILATVEKTPQPPNIQVKNLDINQDIITLNIEATDPDSPNLKHSIQYSNDDGQTWIPITTHLTTESITLNTTTLPGGQTCRIKATTSDGFNTAETITETFTIQDKPPTPVILTQEDTYLGAALDPEDGLITDSNLVWTIDGAKYTGQTAPVGSQVTLTATDSTGNQETITTVTQITLTNHTITDTNPEQGQIQPKQEFKPGDTVYSCLNLEHVNPGDQITWEFISPQSQIYTDNLVLEYFGQGYAYTSLQIPANNTGTWEITVYINQEQVTLNNFQVNQRDTSNLSLLDYLLYLALPILIILYVLRWLFRKLWRRNN